MISKILLPMFSILLRSSIYVVVIVFSFTLYYGGLFNIGVGVFTYFSRETGLLSEYASLLDIFTPIVLLLIVLFTSVRGKQLYMGVVDFLSKYVSTLLFILVILYVLVIYYDYRYFRDYSVNAYLLIIALLLLIACLLLRTKYPLVALSINKIDQAGLEKPLVVDNEVVLKSGEVIRIRIYGESVDVAVKPDPPDSFKLMDVGKTLYYNYVDLKPLSSFGGMVNIYYRDSLVSRFKTVVEGVEYKSLTFKAMFNDDYIGEYTLSVEKYKDLRTASEPVLKSVLSKLGIDEVRDVQFYTMDNVSLPSTILVSDLKDIDTVVMKMYSVEKYMEFLRYMGKKDVHELWDLLIKRLEILRNTIDKFLGELDSVIDKSIKISSDWW